MDELKINEIIKDRYQLLKFLGNGSFGEVWLVHDKFTDRDVALKIYLSVDPSGIDEFQREYSNSVDIASPFLLTPDYFDVYNRRPFLVMKYCENGSSSKLAGKITEEQLWQFIHDVASGLSVLHSQSDPIVHQDIKPDNILIDRQGHFLITDFGISKRLRATMRRQSKRDVSSGAMPYMAPERFESNPKLTTASDIWSLGASIYELATGELPFSGFGGSMQRNGAEIPSLPTIYSTSLNNIMQSCLAVNKEDRPSANEICDASKNRIYNVHIKNKTIDAEMSKPISTEKEEVSTSKSIPKIFVGIAIVAAICIYFAYHLGSSKNAPETSRQSQDSTVITMSGNQSDAMLSQKQVENESNEKVMMPQPQSDSHSSKYPFNPAGCPFIYVKGSDHASMQANKRKTLQLYNRSYDFTIGDDHPNGVRAIITTEGYGENLFLSLSFSDDDQETFFDEFEFLKEDCNMQLTIMDFNKDNECELLLTLQSEAYSISKTYVFKILPHPYKESIVKYLGVAEGQAYMYIEGTNIIAPYGSQGLYSEYMLASNGKIINIEN
jgi:serine/threonine protein kinase